MTMHRYPALVEHLLDIHPGVLLILDPEGRLRACTPAAEAFLQSPFSELENLDLAAVLARAGIILSTDHAIRKAKEDGSWRVELDLGRNPSDPERGVLTISGIPASEEDPGALLVRFEGETPRLIRTVGDFESEDKFQNLFETMYQGVVYQNSEGRIIGANPAAERILGRDLEDMLSMDSDSQDWQAVREDGSEFSGLEHPAMMSLKKRTPFRGVVMGIHNPRENRRRWIRISAVPEFSRGNVKPYRVHCTFDDITELKRAKDALEKTQTELERRVEERTRELSEEIERRKEAKETLRAHKEKLEDLVQERTASLARANEDLIRKAATLELTMMALEASEENLRITLNSIGDAVIATDNEGAVTQMNPVAETLTGFSLSEAEGKPISEIFHVIHTRTGEEAPNPVHRVLKDGEVVGLANHTALIAKGGEKRQISDSAAPIRDLDGNVVGAVLVFRDVTEEYRIRMELEEERERLRQVVQNMPVLLDAFDEDGAFVMWNRECERVSGYTAEEIIQRKDALELLYPDETYREQVREDLLRGGKDFRDREWKIVTKSGAERIISWSSISGSLPLPGWHTWGIGVDITKRRRAEQSLRESESRYRLLVENAPLGIISADLEGRILEANDEMARILSAPSPEELRSINLLDDEAMESSGISQDLRRCMESGETIVSEKPIHSIWEKDAMLRYHLRPIRDESGRLARVQAIVEDISGRKELEKEKSNLENQLHQSQKMEAIGRLAGGIAHDFNNLLTGINGNLSLALMDMNPSDPLADVLIEIRKASEHAAGLTRQLLAFSRKQIIEPKIINLNELVANLQKMLRRIIGEDVELRTDLKKRLGRIKADPGQVEQIIINLVVNARDAMPDGGSLRIATDDVAADEAFRQAHPQAESERFVMLEIADTGLGMEKEIIGKIFEPFFTTKGMEKGTGLGLSTAYGITRQHKGFIDVESDPGRGSTFRVYFPKVMDKAEPIRRSRELGFLMRGTETILLVEDDDIVRNMTHRILARLGYTTLVAQHGAEALEISEKHPGRIHLLLTDVIMPHMNGRELADRLLKSRPNTKYLFSSGYTDNVIVHHGVLEKNMNFIGKPYTPKDLAAKIREILDS